MRRLPFSDEVIANALRSAGMRMFNQVHKAEAPGIKQSIFTASWERVWKQVFLIMIITVPGLLPLRKRVKNIAWRYARSFKTGS
jgi:hypothetical protein